MNALYWFSLAAGAPLLLWLAFSGGSEGLTGDADADGGIFSVVPLSTVAFVLTFFGAGGLVSGWLGANVVGAVLTAVVVSVGAGVLNSATFAWLRRTEASSEVSDRDIEGLIGRVVVPISDDHRGRIVLDVAGARTQMTAASLRRGEGFDAGRRVIVVAVEAGVAIVTNLDPALE